MKSTNGYKRIKSTLADSLKKNGFSSHRSKYIRITKDDILQTVYFHFVVRHQRIFVEFSNQGLFCPGINFNILEPGGTLSDITKDNQSSWDLGTESVVQASEREMLQIFECNFLPWLDKHSSVDGVLEEYDLGNNEFLWFNFSFVNLGYFLLRNHRYDEALKVFMQRPSKVSKFKTIQKLMGQNEYDKIDNILIENISNAISKNQLMEYASNKTDANKN